MRDPTRALLISITAASALGAPIDAAADLDLNLVPDFGLVAMNVVVFSLLIYPTNRLLIQPLLRVLQEREERSGGTLARAEQVREDCGLSRANLEDQVNDMRGAAQVERSTILSESDQKERAVIEEARERASEAVEEVRRTISRELVEARGALQSDARALAEQAAAKILGRSL